MLSNYSFKNFDYDRNRIKLKHTKIKISVQYSVKNIVCLFIRINLFYILYTKTNLLMNTFS